MRNIQNIHEEVFSYLKTWSEQSRTGNTELNPYFYMRSVRDDRFKKGYWFPGNDSYLCISFWSGGDSRNKTPNIYFEINEKFGCRVVIVSKDSESKYEYFEGLVEDIKGNHNNPFVENKRGKQWIKQFSDNYEHWNNELGRFLIHDKRWIDEYIDKNELVDYEEFVSRFGFITPKDFDVMISRVLKERDSIKEIEYRKHKSYLVAEKLPYALLGINIENFQGIKSTGINELRPDLLLPILQTKGCRFLI